MFHTELEFPFRWIHSALTLETQALHSQYSDFPPKPAFPIRGVVGFAKQNLCCSHSPCTSSRPCCSLWMFMDWDLHPSLCFQPAPSSAIAALLLLSLFNLTQWYMGCAENTSGTSSEQQIKALNILWSGWKRTQLKWRRFKQKLIYFSTQKPCLDSLPGSGVTGASSVPCAFRNPKWHIHEKFIIKCVRAPENMKSETSRFPGALGSYHFPSLPAGKATFSLHLVILCSGSAHPCVGMGSCPPGMRLCPRCPASAPGGCGAAEQLGTGGFWRGKWQGKNISICAVMFFLFINKQAAFVPLGASVPYFSCI